MDILLHRAMPCYHYYNVNLSETRGLFLMGYRVRAGKRTHPDPRRSCLQDGDRNRWRFPVDVVNDALRTGSVILVTGRALFLRGVVVHAANVF